MKEYRWVGVIIELRVFVLKEIVNVIKMYFSYEMVKMFLNSLINIGLLVLKYLRNFYSLKVDLICYLKWVMEFWFSIFFSF